jgi:cytochrome oxidase Cu insertion factor (SCO1/SenC/PrrC family)
MNAPPFGSATPAETIVGYIETVRVNAALKDELVALLPEQAPLYAGRSTNEAERLRGYLLASFATTGLPVAALPYVLEELETGRNPYTVAAAARALRGADALPEQVVPLLLQAIEGIRGADDRVWFDSYSPAPGPRPPTTALMELIRTLAWLGPRAGPAREGLKAMLESGPSGFSAAVRVEIRKAIEAVSDAPAAVASCCAAPPAPSPSITASEPDLDRVALQDQDGTLLTFGECFRGRPSAITFFYTRCMNPEKCSLTITKLARLQQRIAESGLRGRVNVAAITYDPAFDLPQRLRLYGVDRGMTFDAHNRLLRTTGPFAPLQRQFDLGVGYGPVTVNRHRLDLVILDSAGRAAAEFSRMLWHEDEVLDALVRLADARRPQVSINSLGSARGS